MPYQCTDLFQGEGRKGNKISHCSLNPEAGRHWGHQLALNTCSMFSEILIRAFNSSRPPDAEAFLPGRPGQRLRAPPGSLQQETRLRESCEPARMHGMAWHMACIATWQIGCSAQAAGAPAAGRGAHCPRTRSTDAWMPLSCPFHRFYSSGMSRKGAMHACASAYD
jgi:hypothetical protein